MAELPVGPTVPQLLLTGRRTESAKCPIRRGADGRNDSSPTHPLAGFGYGSRSLFSGTNW
ncbi:MAG: hypothetical protein QOJ52_4104, partial [Acidimicrobiaceae bacterium]|nr:hypothetical protein [Acidimicrobiaceae bacterium]